MQVLNNKSEKQRYFWMPSMRKFYNQFNISLQNQNKASYLLKLCDKRLPCNWRQFVWGFAATSKCSNCGQKEYQDNIFHCERRQEFINEERNAQINRKIRNIKSFSHQIIENLSSMIREIWSTECIYGIIPDIMIKFLQRNNIQDDDVAKLGVIFVNIGHIIWKKRCKENSVIYQKLKVTPQLCPELDVSQKKRKILPKKDKRMIYLVNSIFQASLLNK